MTSRTVALKTVNLKKSFLQYLIGKLHWKLVNANFLNSDKQILLEYSL